MVQTAETLSARKDVDQLTKRELLGLIWELEADFRSVDPAADHRRHLERADLLRIYDLLRRRTRLKSLDEGVATKSKRALIVDDSRLNQMVFLHALRPWFKEVLIANNGQEAMDRIHSEYFDLILMDVQMPLLDGLAATRQIRQLEANDCGHTRILGVSSGTGKEECLAAGMDDYLPKPVRPQLLCETILSQFCRGQ